MTRLIPWCLAATGFVAALTVVGWQGRTAEGALHVTPQPPAQRGFPTAATSDSAVVLAAAVPVASAAPQSAPDTPETLVLPLPPVTHPDVDPGVQPVPDDEPIVEDLPSPRSPPETTADE